MHKALALLALLLPLGAEAATYTLKGDGECVGFDGSALGQCSAELSFEIASKDFGKGVALYETSNLSLFVGGQEVGKAAVLWHPVLDRQVSDDCAELCAWATTEANGNLTWFGFNNYTHFDHAAGGWTPGGGLWNVTPAGGLAGGTGTWDLASVLDLPGCGPSGGRPPKCSSVTAVPVPPSANLFVLTTFLFT